MFSDRLHIGAAFDLRGAGLCVGPQIWDLSCQVGVMLITYSAFDSFISLFYIKCYNQIIYTENTRMRSFTEDHKTVISLSFKYLNQMSIGLFVR